MSTVDVVIPTWNGCDLLARCLPTIERQDGRCEVIVVDNGSTDRTTSMLAERFPDVHVVALPENIGFGPAVNRGIEAGDAHHVMLINNDVECDPGFVERLVAPLRELPGVGMVAGLLLRPGRQLIDGFGIELDRTLAAFARYAGAPSETTRINEVGLAAPSGGAAAYRRSALAQVGGFDEALFAYMEDVDLGLRLRAAGWLCAGAAEATGVHLGGATIGRRSRRQVEIAGASRAYMLRKYGVASAGPGTAAWALVVEAGVTAIDSLIGRDLGALRGRRQGWRQAAGVREPLPVGAVNEDIGPLEALRRRGAALRSQGESGR